MIKPIKKRKEERPWALFDSYADKRFKPLSEAEAALLILSGEGYKETIECKGQRCQCRKYAGILRRSDDGNGIMSRVR